MGFHIGANCPLKMFLATIFCIKKSVKCLTRHIRQDTHSSAELRDSNNCKNALNAFSQFLVVENYRKVSLVGIFVEAIGKSNFWSIWFT